MKILVVFFFFFFFIQNESFFACFRHKRDLREEKINLATVNGE